MGGDNKFSKFETTMRFTHNLREKSLNFTMIYNILAPIEKVTYFNGAPVIETGPMNKLLGAFAHAR